MAEPTDVTPLILKEIRREIADAQENISSLAGLLTSQIELTKRLVTLMENQASPTTPAKEKTGISIREFARRDGCSETLVRRAIQRGCLKTISDGRISTSEIGAAWRSQAPNQ